MEVRAPPFGRTPVSGFRATPVVVVGGNWGYIPNRRRVTSVWFSRAGSTGSVDRGGSTGSVWLYGSYLLLVFSGKPMQPSHAFQAATVGVNLPQLPVDIVPAAPGRPDSDASGASAAGGR